MAHEDQVDHRGKADVSVAINFKPTKTGEEDMNSSPDGGYNDFTRPENSQAKSDRFKK